MKRSQPLRQRTPLKRKTPLKTSSGSRIPAKVRAQVRERSGGICEAPLDGVCMGLARAVHMHHRLRRSQGGGHTPDNLLHLCHQDHAYIHDHPAWAYEAGLLRRREA